MGVQKEGNAGCFFYEGVFPNQAQVVNCISVVATNTKTWHWTINQKVMKA